MEISKSKATLEAVIAAAEALEAAGIRVSVRNVTEKLGGGSPNFITAHLRTWREQRPVIEQRKAIVIDERIADLIREQVVKAVREATTEAIEARDAAIDERDLIADTGRQLEAQVEQFTAQLAAAADRSQHDAGKIEQLEKDLEKVRADAAAAIDAAKAEAADAIEKARVEAAAERAKSDKLAGELGAAQASVDSLNTRLGEIAKQLVDARADLATEHSSRTEAEKLLAVASSQVQSLSARLAELVERASKAEAALASERAARATAESAAAAAKALADERSKAFEALSNGFESEREQVRQMFVEMRAAQKKEA